MPQLVVYYDPKNRVTIDHARTPKEVCWAGVSLNSEMYAMSKADIAKAVADLVESLHVQMQEPS